MLSKRGPHHMRYGFVIALIFGIILSATPAFANDSSAMLVGDAYVLSPSPHVELVREELRITLEDDRFRVHVSSLYRNHGPTHTVTMAFPENAHYLEGIQDFRSQVDGRPVNVEFQREVYWSDYEREDAYDQTDVGQIYGMQPEFHDAAWVKQIPFEAGQSREVTVEYWAEYGSNVYGLFHAEYLLATGASWRGAIESFSCEVDWSALTQYSPPDTERHETLGYWSKREPGEPIAWKPLSRTSCIWRETDYEPKDIISFCMVEGFWNFTLNGERLPVRDAYGNGLGHQFHSLIRDGSEVWVYWEDLCDYGWSPFDCQRRVPKSTIYCLTLEDDHRTLVDHCDGTRLVLVHPAVERDGEWYVSLRDFIETLGGTYTWNPDDLRVDLTLPNGPYDHSRD